MPKPPKKKKLSTSQVKRSKLIRLQQYMNLETGALDETALPNMTSLYKKAAQYKLLCAKIRKCQKCPGLNVSWITEAAAGWGDLNAAVFIVGQALDEHGVKTGVPLLLGSGQLIDIALALSGQARKDVFLSNAVHCFTGGRRPSTVKEKKACRIYLAEELKIVMPQMVVALGKDAQEAVDGVLGEQKEVQVLRLAHPAAFWKSNNPDIARNWILKLSVVLDKYIGERR